MRVVNIPSESRLHVAMAGQIGLPVVGRRRHCVAVQQFHHPLGADFRRSHELHVKTARQGPGDQIGGPAGDDDATDMREL